MHAHCFFFRYAAAKSYRPCFFILSVSGNFAQVHWVCLKKSRWGSIGKDWANVMSREGPSVRSYMANELWTMSLTVMISLAADSATWKMFG